MIFIHIFLFLYSLILLSMISCIILLCLSNFITSHDITSHIIIDHQNLQALLSAKIRCEQGPGSNPLGGCGKNGGDRVGGGGSNAMNSDYGYEY